MTGLVKAIENTLTEKIENLADRIVRLDVPHAWPVATALKALAQTRQIRILVSRPFITKDFDGMEITSDAGIATQWRNESASTSDTIIVGSPRGRLVDGLRDVTVVNRNAVVAVWSESELEKIRQSGSEDLCKPESINLLEELFDAVCNGVVDANQMVTYLDTLHRDSSVESITKNLWLIGLMEDAKALDTRVSSERVQRNQALVHDLANSDDPRIDSRLKKIIENTRSSEEQIELAKKLKSYREEKDKSHLRGVQLNDVELLLTETAPSPGARGVSFSNLLDNFSEYPSDVSNALKLLRSEWQKSLDSNRNLEITFPLNGATSKCSLKLDELVVEVTDTNDNELALSRPWTRFIVDGKISQVLTVQSDQDNPISSIQIDGNKLITSDFILQRLNNGSEVKEKFLSYLAVREKLSDFEPYLERVDLALPYLILFSDSLLLVRQYLSAWNELMSCIVSLESDENLVYVAQVLETIQHQGDDSPDWIVLGTLHPFRVSPLVEVAEFISGRLSAPNKEPSEVSNLGKAMDWLIDRSYPSYPTVHCKGGTLALASSGINVVYEAKPRRHLPAARDSSGLDQLFRSFIGFSNWYRSGMSVLVIDCPPGGGVAKSLTKLATSYLANKGLSLYELTTSEQADTLASSFDGPVRSLKKSHTLADARPLPQVNVTIRFVHEAQATSESASLEWAPTKGSYLTFELVDSHDDIFSDASISKIKIDPTTRNFAVLRTHELYKKYRGGARPEVATIRPLLETDERPILSSLATNTDWLIFAAPGPLGLVAPTTINKTLRYVGKATMGQYGLYAYAADDLFPVRKKFESYISDTPVSTVPPQRMVEILAHKAKESGNAVLRSATAGVQAELAALVALQIAREGIQDGEFDFVLSLDDFGWTGAWLRDGIRADYLIVRVAVSGDVRVRVLESKSERPGPRIVCDDKHKAFSEGISQVQRTVDVLTEIFFADEPTLDQDLRFSTLIEQLMAAALAEHLKDRTIRLKLFNVINDLSARRVQPTVDGLVVLLQAGVTESRLEKVITKNIRIVAAGRSEVEKTLGIRVALEISPQAHGNLKGDTPVSPKGTGRHPTNEKKQPESIRVESRPKENSSLSTLSDTEDPTPSETGDPVSDTAPPDHDMGNIERPRIPDEYVQLARRLISVAALQKVEVDGAEPVFTLDGPTLITIGVRLKEGASIQPFRARLGDIARDIGLGDKADFIQVENDSMPRTVRVIIPRPEKNIPPVPEHKMTPLSDEGYLPIYMGQTIDGRDYKSTVESWPHMLVAGSTGTGKTTLLKTLLTQLGRYAGDHLQFLIADGKGETDYMNLIPEYGFIPEFPDVQLGAERALEVLKWVVEEMERRREYVVNLARNSSSTQQGINAITLFKEAVSKGHEPPIKPLIIVVDEFADIIISSKKNAEMFENLIQRISQVGRSRMMHLLLATQRPDKETIRGAIKANLNARVVLQLPTQADSMTVLGQSGAEKLLKPGDFLFQRGSGSMVRLQGYRF